MKIERIWAMPSRWTFTIKPIKELLELYVGDGKGWVDPFAGPNSMAEFTNDLNPAYETTYHLEAEEFVRSLPRNDYAGVLFDPPYSLRQLKECYQGIGRAVSQYEAQRFPQNVKELIVPKIKTDGIAISFGWNSQGFGKNLGFKIIEILLVPHGRGHNDTIVTVEKKL